ncbi:hypothetical protein EMWEY_00000330 [Eimeria maxima]|uniref:Uncharacterized protein n=1 Tax=Eimeria maxima TaxID=5804 RepID=U6M4P1_EIMMA|nr:hypothetical protein EMWEY_00000330 [Eimeria maxima]CDJ56635.1 hypothetical protein EMWEY_00000330 [Eimeria maxima]
MQRQTVDNKLVGVIDQSGDANHFGQPTIFEHEGAYNHALGVCLYSLVEEPSAKHGWSCSAAVMAVELLGDFMPDT